MHPLQEILNSIEQKRLEFATHPLFAYLDNTAISPSARLSFAPCASHFVMGFGDLNKYLYRDETSQLKDDPFQQIINLHTYEDDHHWQWFLEDLTKLGPKSVGTFTDTLRFIWSEETTQTRKLCHLLSGYIWNATPMLRFVIAEAVEATGNVLFSKTTRVAAELSELTGQTYRFFGNFHLDKESGHTTGDSQRLQELVNSTQLSDADYQQAVKLVDDVFQLFTNCVGELHCYALKHGEESDLLLMEGG